MRLVTTACVIAGLGGLAVVGIVLTQQSPFSESTVSPVAGPTIAAPAATTAVDATVGFSARPVADAPAPAESPAPAASAAPIVLAQAGPAAPPPSTTAAAPPPAATATSSCPGNPNALGVSRVVEIDTTGGPGFGFEHFKTYDFLREGEVVLTFDDGPWPKNTPAVLAALAAHCTKAIFFPIGIHATWEPAILKQVAAAGHAVGSHTWCHQDLSKTKGKCRIDNKSVAYDYDPKDEIERGISAVRWAVGGPTAPYFRFPALRQPPELIEYLGKRNIAIFSTDLDSFDFKMRKPEQVRQAVLAKLKKNGKGIVLMHDFQHATGEAAMGLLSDLKAGGYKVVFMKPKDSLTTVASYDDWILKNVKGANTDTRPVSSVIRTISE
jgi:peptidoglycan-N-acetylglucosamine deacetylase